ncbi:amino acid permease [Mycoplasma flocculare]|uniref:Putative amino acid permease n=1 Tax=Mesomycoplasma flocculare ATCC 27399 TaxID=743971 RepID=A0A0A8E6E0_MESFC|nr:amino acid permease [Mesomycoplasma flocculare]AJC49810.1 putative amino acid permease [Mesomycoplasma flocculare ATCC 27399]MXR12536.1 amino acid permease [Mesomycoplasma flocculare]MXR56315.1 amino acid permease [Mesomycoplasma flocculare]
MLIKSSRKLGFFAALSMLVGSVVGIGIFFKNNSVANITEHNGYAWLFAWIIGGLISLFAAINFSEISFLKQTKLNGLANWAYQSAGKKAGYLVLFSYSFYYLGILALILGIFSSEITVWFIQTASGSEIFLPFYLHLLIGAVFVVFFTTLNYISVKVSGYFALVSTILKFIPLVFAVFAGILFPNTYNAAGSNTFLNPEKSFNFSKLILALPAVLFAYDSFLSVGSIHNKVENANKRVPLIITVGMIIIVIVYTLIGLSSALHNKGTINDLIQDVFPKSAERSISIFVAFFLLVSTYGVTNSLNAAFVNQITDLVKLNAIVGSASLKKKFNVEKVTIFYLFSILFFWSLIVYIPSIAIPFPKSDNSGHGFGTDVLVDAMSNFPSLIFFGVYMTIIIAYSRKKNQLVDKSKQINKYLFWIAAVISSVLIFTTIIAFIYTQIQAVANDINSSSGAGLFAANGLILTNLGNFLIFIFHLFIFIAFSFINSYLIKIVDKIDIFNNFEQREIEISEIMLDEISNSKLNN